MAEILSLASAITGLITFAGTIWTAIDEFKSVDRNIQDRKSEIAFLSTEFESINELLRTATHNSRLVDSPLEYAGAHHVEAGLVRFKSALDRVNGIMGNVTRRSQGSAGRIRGVCHMRLNEKELGRLKAQIASIQTHLQTMLNTRQSHLLELIAAQILLPNPNSLDSGFIDPFAQAHSHSTSSSEQLSPTTSRSSSSAGFQQPLFVSTKSSREASTPMACRPGSIAMSINATSSASDRSSIVLLSGHSSEIHIPPTPPRRPPALKYTGEFQVLDLKKHLPCRLFKKIHTNCISPSGDAFALLTSTHFAILSKHSLICFGEWQGYVGALALTGPRRQQKTSSTPPKTMVLNDKYLFIGMGNRILVFATTGNLAGTLVLSHDMGDHLIIDKLFVSPDGNTLLVLARNLLDKSQLGLFYPATVEATQMEESFISVKPVVWDDCQERMPSLATFSADGNKVAITTSRCRQKSEIRLLERQGQGWIRRRELIIPVCSSEEEDQIEVQGVTGISILYNKYVVWSVDSSFTQHSWCHFGHKSGFTTVGGEGPRVIQMNPSNEFNAVVRMDNQGS